MESIKANAERFKVLGGDTRLAIIEHLKDGPRTVGDLAKMLSISQPSVSQNLRLLKAAGLVQGQRNGNWINYSLQLEGLMEIQRRLSEVCLCGCDCCPPVDRASLEAYQDQLKSELDRVSQRLSDL